MFRRSVGFGLSLVLIAGIVAASPVFAATWVSDTPHSAVTFKIRHFFTKVNGRFTDFTASIDYDPAKPEAASVTATIQAASITTDNEWRDKDLKGANFFEVEKYPTLTFKSTKVEKVDDVLKVTGDLTMHGVTKPVTLDVEYLGAMEIPKQGWKAGFNATGKLNRKDFGIVWNQVVDTGNAMLGDDVEFEITIEAKPPAAE